MALEGAKRLLDASPLYEGSRPEMQSVVIFLQDKQIKINAIKIQNKSIQLQQQEQKKVEHSLTNFTLSSETL